MEREAGVTTTEEDFGRSQELIEKMDTLKKLNKQLRDRLSVKEKMDSPEANLNASMCRPDSSLHDARENMTRVMKVMEKYVSK
jgi:succinate dehydrogenase/fumarate reductase flavoprotein subunit